MELNTEHNVFDKALIRYERSPWLRALVQALPGFGDALAGVSLGGSIDTLLTWRGVSITRRRYEEFIDKVEERLTGLETTSIDLEFLSTDKFHDIFRESVDAVSRSSSSTKRAYVANFLAGVIHDARIEDISEQVIDDLRFLKDFHLAILERLDNSMVAGVVLKSEKGYQVLDLHALRENSKLEPGLFSKGLADLMARGFIRSDSVGTAWGAGDVLEFRPTAYFREFRQAISKP